MLILILLTYCTVQRYCLCCKISKQYIQVNLVLVTGMVLLLLVVEFNKLDMDHIKVEENEIKVEIIEDVINEEARLM